MRLGKVWSVMALIALCAITSVLLQCLAASVPDTAGSGRILAVSAPRDMTAGQRYGAYAGFDLLVGDSYVVRICSETGGCPVRRTEEAKDDGEVWGWVATLSPATPVGGYRGEVFVRRSGILGVPRTVASFGWDQRVE